MVNNMTECALLNAGHKAPRTRAGDSPDTIANAAQEAPASMQRCRTLPAFPLILRPTPTSIRRRNAAIAGERRTYSAVLHQGKPMSEVLPFRKPPSKPKQDDETPELLKLLERIARSVKTK